MIQDREPRPDNVQRLIPVEQIEAEIRKRVTFARASPPLGFDPLTAGPEELELYKLPPRPDAKRTPVAFANWKRAMSQPLRFAPDAVVKRYRADPVTAFRIATQRRQQHFLSSSETSRNWSGVYIRDNPGEGFATLQASWMVPRPYPPPPFNPGDDWRAGEYHSTTWIGLDGHEPGSRSLPQVGTAQNVTLDADSSDPDDLHVATNAWWQWWVKGAATNHPIDIPSDAFPIKTGDLVYMQMDVIGPLGVIEPRTVTVLSREPVLRPCVSTVRRTAALRTAPTPDCRKQNRRMDRRATDGSAKQ